MGLVNVVGDVLVRSHMSDIILLLTESSLYSPLFDFCGQVVNGSSFPIKVSGKFVKKTHQQQNFGYP